MPTDLFETYPLIGTAMALLALACAALFANFGIKVVLLRLVNRLLSYTPYGRDSELTQHGIVERLANLMPAMVISVGIVLVPNLPEFVVVVVRNVANATIILLAAMAISAMFNIVDVIYHRRPQARLRPIK